MSKKNSQKCTECTTIPRKKQEKKTHSHATNCKMCTYMYSMYTLQVKGSHSQNNITEKKTNSMFFSFSYAHLSRMHVHIYPYLMIIAAAAVKFFFLLSFFLAFRATKCLLECMLFRRCFDFFSLPNLYEISVTLFFTLVVLYQCPKNFSYSPIRQFFSFSLLKKNVYFVIIGSFQRLCVRIFILESVSVYFF